MDISILQYFFCISFENVALKKYLVSMYGLKNEEYIWANVLRSHVAHLEPFYFSISQETG